jgi:hypothetical protein
VIKVNLLPPFVVERKLIIRFLKAVIVLVIVWVALLGWYVHGLQTKLAAEKQRLADETAKKTAVEQTIAAIASVQGQTAPIKQWVDFYAAVQTHAQKYVTVLDLLTRYTSNNSILSSWTGSGTAVTIAGSSAGGTRGFARYYLNIIRCPLWAKDAAGEPAVVITSALGGWSLGMPGGAGLQGVGSPMPGAGSAPGGGVGLVSDISLSLSCTLANEYNLTAPGAPGGAAAPAPPAPAVAPPPMAGGGGPEGGDQLPGGGGQEATPAPAQTQPSSLPGMR